MIGISAKRVLDQQGRIIIPKKMRVLLQIEPGDDVTLTREEERIVVSKGPENSLKKCFVTGEWTTDFMMLPGNRPISKQAAAALRQEITSLLKTERV